MISAYINRHSIGWPLLSVIAGVSCGFLIIMFFKLLSSTYATMATFAVMSLFIVFIVGGAKYILWLILITCLPITLDISLGDTGHISGTAGYLISAFDMILALLLLLWFAELVRGKKSMNLFPSLSIPAISLISVAALSMVFAPYPFLSLLELIEIIKMYICFLYIANNIRSENEVKVVIAFLLLGLLFEGILGVAQHRYSEPFFPTALGGPPRIHSRVTGTWISPNDFAWYLSLIIPIAISLLFSQIKLSYKIICSAAFVVGCASLVWSSSRGGWISTIVAVLIMCPLIFSRMKDKKDIMKSFTVFILVIILISPLYPRLFDKISERMVGDDGGSAESRFPQYEMAYNILSDNPYIGAGLNNYTKIMNSYDITDTGIESLTPHAVHNIFLHIAAEIGIFGIAAFLWFISRIYIEGIRCIILHRGILAYIVIGILGGIVSFLIHGLVDTAALGNKMYLFIWFFAGIIFAIKTIKPSVAVLPGKVS